MPVEEYRQQARTRWVEALASACEPNPPASAEWHDLLEIEKILSSFVGDDLAHAHLPNGGGLDFKAIEFSAEDECLTFQAGEHRAFVLKPAKLRLEYIAEHPAESFLLLDAKIMRPLLGQPHRGIEEVLDLGDGQYVDRQHWAEGTYGHDGEDDVPLPEEARLTTRHLGGVIMLVSKGSFWNRAPGTYNGEHAELEPDMIRQLILKEIGNAGSESIR